VIVATGSNETEALQTATPDIPIVFLQIPDPLALGLVEASPGRAETSRDFRMARKSSGRNGLASSSSLWDARSLRLAWLGNPAMPVRVAISLRRCFRAADAGRSTRWRLLTGLVG